ncbi:MAG TPA: polysaccharide deacetylase family protein [bacterium]|nr:polysaccharide deacetylase family protein [bacterium]
MILAYHRINSWHCDDALSVSPAMFESQIKFLLRKGYQPVSLYEYLKKQTPKKIFCITFDDGFADNILAVPIMKKYGIKPTVFLIAHNIGTEKIHKKYKDRERDRYLNWKEVHKMLSEGVIFGSHTLTHPRLTELPRKQAWDEIFESRKFIEKNIGQRVDFFSYPYGIQDEKIRQAVKKAGYKGAVITNWKGKYDVYSLPRIGVYGHNSFFIFRVKIWRANIISR